MIYSNYANLPEPTEHQTYRQALCHSQKPGSGLVCLKRVNQNRNQSPPWRAFFYLKTKCSWSGWM